MKLIVGLGNPGKEYLNTRHNVGFMCVDNYVDNLSWHNKFKGLVAEKMINGEKILFLKPLTFMNLSGESVQLIVKYYNIDLKDILIIHDDLDLPLGFYKLKVNSSSGGHNGIKSIIEMLKANSFARLKIGISHDHSVDTKDYVLGKFSTSELEILNRTIQRSKDIIDCYIKYGIEKTMNIYNTK